MEDLIEEMRDAFIAMEKRSFDLGKISELTMRRNISDWQKMERELVNRWFDKFFVFSSFFPTVSTFKETKTIVDKSEPHSLNPHPEKDHDGW